MKIWKTTIPSDADMPGLLPGEIGIFHKKRLLVGTADGLIEILSLQPETKKIMDAASFINGYRPVAQDRFGV